MRSSHGEVPISISTGATPNQIDEIVELFDEAFAAKFRVAIPDAHLRKKYWSEVLIHEQITLAEKGGEILGIALTSSPNRPGFSKDAPAKLFQVLGKFKGLRAAFIFTLFRKLDWKPEPSTRYIEALCVSSKARGLGLGTQILEYLSSAAKSHGMTRLALQVTLENPEAKKLYLRRGFEVIHTSRFPILKMFTGTYGADTMKLSLTE